MVAQPPAKTAEQASTLIRRFDNLVFFFILSGTVSPMIAKFVYVIYTHCSQMSYM
jgi:hypothetical protein